MKAPHFEPLSRTLDATPRRQVWKVATASAAAAHVSRFRAAVGR